MAYQSEIEKLQKQWLASPDQYFAPYANELRKSGDLEMAVEIVRGGLARRPNSLSAHIVLGRCLLDLKNDPEAAKVFEHVLVLDAENIIALRYLGDIEDRAGNPAAAQRWWQRLLDVDPMNDEAVTALKRLDSAAAGPSAVEPVEPPPPQVPEEPVPVRAPPARRSTAAEAMPSGPPSSGAANEFGIEQASSPFETSDSSTADMSGLDVGANEITFSGDASVSGSKLELQEPEPEVAFDESRKSDGGSLLPSGAPSSYEPPMIAFDDPPAATPPAEPEPELPEPAAQVVDEPQPRASRQPAGFVPSGDLPLIMPDDVEPEPAAPSPPPAVEPLEPEPVITETMAEVYLRQGLLAEARDVYRKLVQKRPGDAGLRDKLAALEQQRLTPPRGVPAVQAGKPRFAASETGGVSARSLFGKVLSSRPGASASGGAVPPSPPPDSHASPMEAAFADEPHATPGAPTRPTSDELSLAEVFGEDPVPPPSPKPVAAPAPPAAPAEPGFSFDEFFGGKRGDPPPPAQETSGSESEGGSPDDFLAWLKGLKS